jgi:hypothetical protein
MFETWDRRTGSTHGPEITSRATSLAEAERACRNDRGRLLTIYDADGFVRAMYRDGVKI